MDTIHRMKQTKHRTQHTNRQRLATRTQPKTVGESRNQPRSVGKPRTQPKTVGETRTQPTTVSETRTQPKTVGEPMRLRRVSSS